MAATVVTRPETVSLRWIEKRDLDLVVEAEAAAHRYEDPDFQVQVLPRYAWDREDFAEVIRQYKSKSKMTGDTRVLVAEVLVEEEGPNGLKTREPVLVGTLAYEIADDGYRVLLMSAPDDEVRESMLKYLVNKLGVSDTRHKLTVVVPDGHWPLLKYLMKNEVTGDSKQKKGFSVRLDRDPHPEGFDVWLAEYSLPDPAHAPAASTK